MTKKTKKISALLMALALTLTSLLSTSSTAFASTLENANLSKTVKTTDINNNISISNDKLSAPLRAASNLRVEKGRTYLGNFTFHDKKPPPYDRPLSIRKWQLHIFLCYSC